MATKNILSTHSDDTANVLKEKGKGLFVAKKYDRAAAEYTKIIEEHNDGAAEGFIHSILCNRAACSIALGHYHKALTDLTEISSNPTTSTPISTLARTHYRLAQCHYNLGDYEKAKASMDAFDDTILSRASPKDRENDLNEMLASAAVRALKKTINDKRTTAIQTVEGEGGAEIELVTDGAFALAYKRFTYVVLIPASCTRSVYDSTLHFPNIIAPTSLLTASGTHNKKALHKFLAELGEKHQQTVLNAFVVPPRRRLTCWKCDCPAKGLKHDPDATRLFDGDWVGGRPRVVDVVRPVCGTDEVCAHQPVGPRGAVMNMNRKDMKALARRVSRRVKARSNRMGYGYGMDMDDPDFYLAAMMGVLV